MKSIGYLGPKGTFTELAAKVLFPNDEKKAYTTIPNSIVGVAEGEVDHAVVPIENAIEGSVNLTLDYIIHKNQIPIIGEITVPIGQHLLVHPKQVDSWREAEIVYSHPHAIAQCHEFIRKELPNAKIQYTNSTGAAAKLLHDDPSLKGLAIANELAAEEYQLAFAQRDIHDFDNNRTRFVILSPEEQELKPSLYQVGEKTTLVVTLPSDYSGALHQVLSAFAWRKLNLSKIESRPMKTGLGNYFFVIDVEQRLDDVLIPGVKAELEALGCGVRILGSYPCFSLTNVNKVKKTVPD